MAQHHMTEVRRRSHLHKRQRPAVTDEVLDATTTVPRAGRPVATAVDESEDVETDSVVEEEPETTRRGSRPRPEEETTSEAVVGAPTPARATQITTSDAEEPLVTAAVPTTAPAAPVVTTTSELLTPVAPVVPTTRSTTSTSSIRTSSSSTPSSSSSLLPISSPGSSSPLPLASAADANNAATSKSEDGAFPIGTVVGVIVAVVAVVALLVGFLIWRKKRRSRSDDGLDAAMGGYVREKSNDNEFGEKPQDYSMAAIPPAQRNSLQQHGAPLPSPIAMPVQQQQQQAFQSQPFQPQPAYNIPHSVSMPNGFAPPKAAMMGSPSIRSSVASPYGLIAAAGLSSPPQQQQSFDQPEDQGPFEDPQWANKLFTVTRTFEPSMPDELVIYPGDTVRILMAYDDGWVLGENLSAVQSGVPVRGVFPRDCVEDLVEGSPAQQQMDDNLPLQQQQESTLTRAPTLPPLNLGRESQSFQTSMAPNRASLASVAPIEYRQSTSIAPQSVPLPADRSSIVSMHQQHLARQSRQSLAPVIAIEEEPHASEGHMSNSSSLNGAIGQFPNTPSRQLTPVVEDDARSARSLKRTSSLMASKDQDLFAQLGQVMQGDLDDEEKEEQDKRESKASK